MRSFRSDGKFLPFVHHSLSVNGVCLYDFIVALIRSLSGNSQISIPPALIPGAGVWAIGHLAMSAAAIPAITATVNTTGHYTNIAAATGNQANNNGPAAATGVVVTFCLRDLPILGVGEWLWRLQQHYFTMK